MNDPEPWKDFKAAEYVQAFTFEAVKRDSDRFFGIMDIVLAVAFKLALYDPPPGNHAVTLTIELEGGGVEIAQTIASVHRAVEVKYLTATDYRGRRKPTGQVARELIIDILANKEDWKPYAAIFAAFAKCNDQYFLAQVARGVQRQRKRVFNPLEITSLLNWHEWNDPVFKHLPNQPPPLKHWTAQAAIGLFQQAADARGIPLKIGEKGILTAWKRIGLQQQLPAKVTGFYPARDKSGWYKIHTAV